MELIDAVLMAVLVGFALFGLWFGFVSAFGSLLGTLVGLFISSRIFLYAADALIKITNWSGNFPKIVSFILVFLIVNRLVSLLFFFLDKFLSVFTRLPILNGINRILGFLFGAFEGILVVAIFVYIIKLFPLSPLFMSMLSVSKVANFSLYTASFLWSLLPESLRIM